MQTELCEFEREMLESMDGKRPAKPWSAAVGAALEFLKGRGLVQLVWTTGSYELTEAGWAAVERGDAP